MGRGGDIGRGWEMGREGIGVGVGRGGEGGGVGMEAQLVNTPPNLRQQSLSQ
jgi:hypothetical protein